MSNQKPAITKGVLIAGFIMTRHCENKTGLKIQLKLEDKAKLKSLIIKLGYTYKRGEGVEPAWGEFFEAIAKGDIILYKKVE